MWCITINNWVLSKLIYRGKRMKKALLIIDVQNGMFQKGNVVHNGEQLLRRIKSLLDQARFTKTPVFYIQHQSAIGKPLEYGTHGWEIHPEIAPEKEDIIIQKTTPDAFFHTSLEQELNQLEIEQLIITGIQTEACVDTTCRGAFSKHYKITLVSDAHSTWDTNLLTAEQIIGHHNEVLRWFADVYPCSKISF